MKTVNRLFALSVLSLFPLQAMADDSHTGDWSARKAHHEENEQKYFDKMDTNKDGVVSKDEWLAYSAARFKEIDANGDGKITKDEMKSYHDKKHAEWREKHATMSPAAASSSSK